MTAERPLSPSHAPYVGGIYLVEVGVSGDLIEGVGGTQLWVAALPAGEAVGAVRKLIPENWTASLRPDRLPEVSVTRLNLRAGEVRELRALK